MTGESIQRAAEGRPDVRGDATEHAIDTAPCLQGPVPAGWPHARRFSLLPGRAEQFILLIQTDQGMHRFDIHARALDELLENARAARAGERIKHALIDAATGEAFPDQVGG